MSWWGVSVQQQIFRLVRGKRSSYAPASPTPPCQHPAMTLWKWITTITTSPFPHVQYTQRQTSGETDLWAYFSHFLLRAYIFIYHNILLIEKHSIIIIIIPNDPLGSLVSYSVLQVLQKERGCLRSAVQTTTFLKEKPRWDRRGYSTRRKGSSSLLWLNVFHFTSQLTEKERWRGQWEGHGRWTQMWERFYALFFHCSGECLYF